MVIEVHGCRRHMISARKVTQKGLLYYLKVFDYIEISEVSPMLLTTSSMHIAQNASAVQPCPWITMNVIISIMSLWCYLFIKKCQSFWWVNCFDIYIVFSGLTMVLIIEFNSEHDAHVWRKTVLFGEKNPICDWSRTHEVP
mgnify:CR=1 FL=1